jgi:hypothetical protein
MADHTHAVQHAEGVRGTDMNGKVVVLTKTHPEQLVLFQTFLCDEEDHGHGDDKYSNTIELYDAIPKYFSNPRLMDRLRKDGKYLPMLERLFKHRGESYTVKIWPARLEDSRGGEKHYYPGPREELVEEALRKLACDHLNGVYLGDLAGVQFTLYELTKELKSRGHDIKYTSLIEALRICHRIDLSVYKGDGKIVLEAPIFPILLLGSKKDWLKAPKETRCYVQFHPLITQCISQLTYRQFDYGAYMTYKHRLSRWLHKRLSHTYTQAGFLSPYTIRMSTIMRDSGTYQAADQHENMRRINEALTELNDRQVLLSITKDMVRGPRNRIVDVKYTMLPTIDFIEEMKKANRRAKKLVLEYKGSKE